MARALRIRSVVLRRFISIGCVVLGLVYGVVAVRPGVAHAELDGSHHVAVLGARTEFFGFLGTRLPSVPGVQIERLSAADVTPTRLQAFDTLVDFEDCNVHLQPSQQAAIKAWFQAGGRKLIGMDSDACPPVDYSTLTPFTWSTSNPGRQGAKNAPVAFVANTPLGSNDPASPYFVDLGKLSADSDSGDTHVATSHSPELCAVATATNVQGVTGPAELYAYAAAGRSLLIFAGWDLDFLGTSPEVNRLFELMLLAPWDATEGEINAELPPGPDCPHPVAAFSAGPDISEQATHVGKDIMNTLLRLLPTLLPLALLFIIARRNELVRGIRWLVGAPASPVVHLRDTLKDQVMPSLWKGVLGALAGTRRSVPPPHQSLSEPAGGGAGQDSTPAAAGGAGPDLHVWNLLIEPGIHLALFLALALTDFYVSGQAFAAMMQVVITLPSLPFDIGALMGLVYVEVVVVFAAVGDALLHRNDPGRRWSGYSPRTRQVALWACGVGLGLAMLDGALFGVWKSMQQTNTLFDPTLNSVLPLVVTTLLNVLMLGATVLIGWTAWVGFGGVSALVPFVLWLGAATLWFVSAGLVLLAEGVRRILTIGVDMVAWFPAAFWNVYLWDVLKAEPVGWITPTPIDHQEEEVEMEQGAARLYFPGRDPRKAGVRYRPPSSGQPARQLGQAPMEPGVPEAQQGGSTVLAPASPTIQVEDRKDGHQPAVGGPGARRSKRSP